MISIADHRSTYLATARTAVALVEHPAVRDRWDEASVLDGMSVGELAAHLARSVLQVEMFLDAPDPRAAEPVTAGAYYGELVGTTDPDSDLNVGVRARSRQTADGGWTAVSEQARRTLDRLTERLPREDDERQLLAFGGRALTVDEYLRTRLVEFCVHLEDLELSVGLGPGLDAADDIPDPPDDALAAAVDVLVEAARQRHGDAAVLRALTRRERDVTDALRVL